MSLPAKKPQPFSPSKPLDNPRQEVFAKLYAAGATMADAYRDAGYKATGDILYSAASQLSRNLKVTARVRYLQEKAADESVLTKAWLIGQAQGILADARRDKAHSAAARMVELLGREKNTFIEKKEVGRPGDFSGMSDEDLRAYIERERQAPELGLGGAGASPAARSNGSGGVLH